MAKYGTAKQATDDNVMRQMHIVCWIPKGLQGHSEYVVLIAFTLQQWFYKRATMLRLYVHCLSCYKILLGS